MSFFENKKSCNTSCLPTKLINLSRFNNKSNPLPHELNTPVFKIPKIKTNVGSLAQMEEEGISKPIQKTSDDICKSSDLYSKSYPLQHLLEDDQTSSQKKKKKQDRFKHLVALALDDKGAFYKLNQEVQKTSEGLAELLATTSAMDKYSDLIQGPSYYLFPKFKQLLQKTKYADQVLCLMDKYDTCSGSFLDDLNKKVLKSHNLNFG